MSFLRMQESQFKIFHLSIDEIPAFAGMTMKVSNNIKYVLSKEILFQKN
jgi:hypothetical protein